MLYKTTKDFLMRFGLRDITELPAWKSSKSWPQVECRKKLFAAGESALPDATGTPDDDGEAEQMTEDSAEVPQNVTEPPVSSDPEHDKADEQAADHVASESTGN